MQREGRQSIGLVLGLHLSVVNHHFSSSSPFTYTLFILVIYSAEGHSGFKYFPHLLPGRSSHFQPYARQGTQYQQLSLLILSFACLSSLPSLRHYSSLLGCYLSLHASVVPLLFPRPNPYPVSIYFLSFPSLPLSVSARRITSKMGLNVYRGS